MFKKIFSLLIILIFGILIFGGVYFCREIYGSRLSGETLVFDLEKGQGVKQVAKNLKEAGLIKNKFIFEAYVYLRRIGVRLQAGEYVVNKGLGIRDLANYFISGKALSKEQEIKTIEGWNVRQIGQYFENLGMFQSEEVLELIGQLETDNFDFKKFKNNVDESYDFLKDKPRKVSLEGYLFPDTYRVYKDASLQDIIKKMLDNFNRKLTLKMREDIKNQGRSIFEIITMASIIELEVPQSLDRKMIADIFWRRVDNGVPLQSDATINYVTGKNEPAPSLEDLKVDSLYNTYLYPDLPLGPIGNPGFSAIEAAIYPMANDYWFYLSKPDGETVFSKTHDEHVKNKAKWLK